jgi:hypothetical protein
MRQYPQRACTKAQQMNASLVANDARFMLEQLSLPVDPRDSIKARRERAIRRAGISPAKGMRLWYSQTCALLAHEYFQIKEAYRAHVETQEARLAEELNFLRQLQAREQQHDFAFADRSPSKRPLAPAGDAMAHVASDEKAGARR